MELKSQQELNTIPLKKKSHITGNLKTPEKLDVPSLKLRVETVI